MRAQLLCELEECGKMLSERNYVVAEERLENLKNKFTGGFRLADLQRIYEALMVRTRVELEKEFEDLRSNIIEPVKAVPVAKPRPAPQAKRSQNELQKQYMDAFEAGKKYFENSDWQRALAMWQTARRINPQDVNLTHWIALAENHLVQKPPQVKPSPVRATIAFLSVFVLTAIITYLSYEKYDAYSKQTKNRILIQRAIEHYRAGRLEESWKTLQIYVSQDPEDESARTLLERITAEINSRKTDENRFTQIDQYLRKAREEKNVQHFAAAIESYQKVVSLDPANAEARNELEQLRKSFDSSQMDQKVSDLITEADTLLSRKQLDLASEKLNQARGLDPGNGKAVALFNRIESERNAMNRIAVQLEVARYLSERNEKESAILVLNRILASDPSQAQAKQLLLSIRTASSLPKSVVEIHIQPAARLWVDGRDLGTNSYFRQMETVGSHIIHIEKQGYHSIDQGIEVSNSPKNNFQFQLKAM